MLVMRKATGGPAMIPTGKGRGAAGLIVEALATWRS